MGADDPRTELASLVRGVRAHLQAMERGGATAVLGGASPRPVAQLEPSAPVEPEPQPLPQPQPPEGGQGTTEASPPEQRDLALAERAAGEPETLAAIRADLGDCQRCKLSRTRLNIAFGVGDERTPLMFVGEAPGADEDRLGEPFVGRAGQLLDKMIAAMGWTRESVYIANVLKCRPPGNRDPHADEVASCQPFLERQIAAIGPRIIVTLGKPAAHLLLRSTAPISALRGRFHDYRGIPVMPTFHPAFLLRSPERKRDAWSDLKQVIARLEQIGVRAPGPPRA